MSAQDRVERYRIEIDVDQASRSYAKLIEASDRWLDSQKRVSAAAKSLADAQRALSAARGAGKDIADAEKRYAAALKESKAAAREAQKANREVNKSHRELNDSIAAYEKLASSQGKIAERQGRAFFSQAKGVTQIKEELAELVARKGAVTAMFDSQGRAMDNVSEKVKLIIGQLPALRDELQRLVSESPKQSGEEWLPETAALKFTIPGTFGYEEGFAKERRQETEAQRAYLAQLKATEAEERKLTMAKLEQEKVARAQQAAAEKTGRAFFNQAKNVEQARREFGELVARKGAVTAMFDSQGRAMDNVSEQIRMIIKDIPVLRDEFNRLVSEGPKDGPSMAFTVPGTFQFNERWKEQRRAETEEQKQYLELLKQEAVAHERAIRAKQRSGREIIRQIKAHGELRGGLRTLIDEEGRLTAEFDENGNAANAAAEDVLELVKGNRQLLKVIQDITRQAGGASVSATAADVPSGEQRFAGMTPFEMRQFAYGLDMLGIRGAGAAASITTSLSGLNPVLGIAAIGIAGVAIAITKVTKAAVAMGKAAAKAFGEMIKDSVELASKFDSVEKSFTGVFAGNEAAAIATIKRIREESIRLGVDIEEIVRKALPLVGTVEEAVSLGALAVGLAQLDPKLGEQGAVRAIQAGLVGNLEPLRKSFDIDVRPIVEAQQKFGDVQGLLIGLGEVLEARGLDVDTLGMTFNLQISSMKQRWEDFRLVIGEPIVDVLYEDLLDIGKLLHENQDNLEIIANAIGELVAGLANLVGDKLKEFLEGFDQEDAEMIAVRISELSEALQALVTVVLNRDFSLLPDLLEPIGQFVSNFIHNMAAALILTDAFIDAKRELDQGETLLEDLPVAGRGIQFARILLNSKDAADAFRDSLQSNAEAARQLLDSYDTAADKVEDFSNSLRESDDVARAQADAIRMVALATSQHFDAQATLGEERLRVQEEQNKALIQLQESNQRSIIEADRARIDNEKQHSQQRIDANTDLIRRLDQLRDKYLADVRDAGIKFEQDQEDAATSYADKMIDIDKDLAKKRIDVENDFQKKLDEIRRKFDFQAEEAIRNNDAVALLRIRRQMRFELNEARISRDEKIADEERAADEARERERTANDRALRDAEIAYNRRLQALTRGLDDQTAAANVAYEQQLEDLKISEERKREEIQENLNRQNADFIAAYRKKFDELQRSLDDEVQAVREAAAAKVLAEQRAADLVAAAWARARQYSRTGGVITGWESHLPGMGGTPLNPPGGSGGGAKRARGGPIFAGQPVIVGDPDPARPNQPNPELIVPTQNGMVIPLSKMMFSPPNAGGSSTIHDYRRSINAQIDLTDLDRLSPAAEQRVRSLITEMLVEAISA